MSGVLTQAQAIENVDLLKELVQLAEDRCLLVRIKLGTSGGSHSYTTLYLTAKGLEETHDNQTSDITDEKEWSTSTYSVQPSQKLVLTFGLTKAKLESVRSRII